METEKQMQKKTELLFDIHSINNALHNLNFSIIYNEIDKENAQHYIKKLIETLDNIDLNKYTNL